MNRKVNYNRTTHAVSVAVLTALAVAACRIEGHNPDFPGIVPIAKSKVGDPSLMDTHLHKVTRPDWP